MSAIWHKTKIPNVLRHKNGRYYFRYTEAGKQFLEALRTNVAEVAKIEAGKRRAEVDSTRTARRALADGRPTMGQLHTIYLAHVAARAGLSDSSKVRYREFAKYIPKTWPGFAALRPDQVTLEAVEGWRNQALTTGTGYRPKGATGECAGTRGNSAGTFNKAVDALRLILNMAVDRGLMHHNPLLRRGVKAKHNPRKPKLPEATMLRSIFAEIETGSDSAGGWGVEIADFCRGLAFTGCRLSELCGLKWADIDFGRGVVRVAGTKTAAANREVPMIPDARALFEKVRARRVKSAEVAVDGVPFVDPVARVFTVSEAARSLSRACKKLGAVRLTHHDLRDAFATTAIEAGVDIPTVAAWLGHADGGALLMKTYAHHRRPHSVAQAAKVSFGGA